MSDESEFVKLMLTILSTVIGINLGGVMGAYGLYYFCLSMDTMQVGGPGGFVGAGWAFLFFTIPIGILAGGGLGFVLPLLTFLKKNN